MSSQKKHHLVHPPNPDGMVDYENMGTETAVEVSSLEGETPRPSGVFIDYGAAQRRPSKPPSYNLKDHYTPPTQTDVSSISAYEGPEHFAPTPDPADRLKHEWSVMETPIPTVSTPRHGVQKTPLPDLTISHEAPTNQYSFAEELPTRQHEGLAAQIASLDQDVAPPSTRAMLALSPTAPQPPVSHAETNAAHRPTTPLQTMRPPLPPHLRKRPPFVRPPVRPPHTANRPKMPLRGAPASMQHEGNEPDTNVKEVRREESGVFVADEFEHAALKTSPWVIVGVLGSIAFLMLLMLGLMALAFAGDAVLYLQGLLE